MLCNDLTNVILLCVYHWQLGLNPPLNQNFEEKILLVNEDFCIIKNWNHNDFHDVHVNLYIDQPQSFDHSDFAKFMVSSARKYYGVSYTLNMLSI